MRISALLLVGLCGWLGLGGASGCGGGGKKGDLTAVGEPRGALEGPPRIVVTFSRPMVKAEAVDKIVTEMPLSFEPKLAGEAKWVNDKALVVTPTEKLPVSTKYVVTISKSAKALDGAVLGIDSTFEFFTKRLSGEIEAIGLATHATKDQLVRLTFNQEVPFAQVTKHCAFTASAKDKKLSVKPAADNPKEAAALVFLVQPAGELSLDTDWTLSCSPELRGSVGNLGPAAAVEGKFRTYGPMKFLALEPTGDDLVPDESLTLDLTFSNPLKEPYQIAITPAVTGFPQRCHALDSEKPGLSCGVPLEARTSYTIKIAAAQEDLFGQKLGAEQILEFRTTDAKPTLSMESGYFIAELKRPVVPVWTRNVKELRLRIVPITQDTFHELQPKLQWWETEAANLAGTRLVAREKTIAIAGEKNKWGQRPVDPAELLGGKAGPGMYYVEVGSKEVERFSDGGVEKILVNFTDIGIVSKISGSRGLVWATQLSTGKPLPGAAISVRDGDGKVTWTGTTDSDGLAVLPGTSRLMKASKSSEQDEESSGEDALRIYAQKDADWTMVAPNRSGGLSPWAFNVAVDRDQGTTKLRGFMHTDRGLYRAGETVHVKGLARVTKLGEPLAVPGGSKKVAVTVEGPQGGTVLETEAKLSAFGGFWFDLDLPGDARLGDYIVRAQLEHGTFTREFSVEAYRPATFEVSGKSKAERLVREGNVAATISANYFYGAPLRAGDVKVTVHSRPRAVDFPGFDDYRFSDDRRYESYDYSSSEDSQTMVTEDQLTLDNKGNAALSVAIGPNDVSSDADLLIRADVVAPSNEVISKTFTVPYFKSKTYFGIKTPGYFLDVGKPAKFEIIRVGADGKPVSGTAKVKVTRRDWNCAWEDWGYRGSYQCKSDDKVLVDKAIQLVAGTPTPIEITPESGGDYLLVVEGDKGDNAAAPAAQQLYAWGDGGGSWQSNDNPTFAIVTDKKEYKAGDTATLILKTDLAQATGLVTIERDGVLEKRMIEVTPKQKHLKIAINGAYAPNVYVSVALVQGRLGDGNRGKPRMRMGVVNLPVRPEDNKLTVAITTDKGDYRPGAPVTATVKVTDKAGNPVSAEVSITAADEGVLSLIGYKTPDPVPTFYAPWGLGVLSATQYEYLRDIPGPNLERPATGGDAPGSVRSRFVSTAVWVPAAVTDASGLATVKFAAPDNLTAFRVMAVAADNGYRFGSGDKRFTVSKPLQLHQALPRFLSLGDQLSGGVVVHNETGKIGSATVKLVADGHVKVDGALEQTVSLAKGARVPVLFNLTATEIGESALKFSVTMNGENDAVILKLPVQHPSPILAHHVEHGAIQADKAIALTLPPDTIAGSAELVVSIDPDGLSGIEQGLSELIGYPYGCLEQTTSKVIPMIAVRELAESLALDGLTGEKLQGFVNAGIARIGNHQTTYGGFSLWPGGEPEAYYTAYALWGLHLAKQAGYRVDPSRIADGLAYLRRSNDEPGELHPYQNEAGQLGSAAFALYVRAVLGDKDAAAATTMIGLPKLPIYGKAFLARALAAGTSKKDPAVKALVAQLAELAAAAAKDDKLIEEANDFYGYMSSSLRTTAIVLGALVELDPKNAAVKPLVRVLMKKRRTVDSWDTQQNLYSLLALTGYAKAQGGKAPSVTIALGAQELTSGELSGKQRMKVVTAPLPAAAQLTIKPSGEVNYSIEIRHRKSPQALKPVSNGIALTREYLDEAGAPKTTFQVGDIVVVRLTTELGGDDEHLIVSEPLPAGFEAINTRLATVGDAGVKESQQWGTYREMLDDRVNFASAWTYKGGYTYEFSMRATSAGKFARPPTVAELMYDPATHARGGFDVLEVKAK